jgi:uncharacterized protein (TIRG00374 family)
MRKFIFALVLLLAVIFIIGRFAEVQSIIDTLKQGDWRFFLLAGVVELAWLGTVAGTFKVIFKALGLAEKFDKLVAMSAAMIFINVVAPSAGMGGLAIFISESRHSGNPSGRVTVASVLFVLYDYASLLIVLTLGFIVLFRRNNITATDITAALILVIIASALASLLYLGTRSAKKLGDVLAYLARLVNRFVRPLLHRDYLQESRAHEFAQDAADALSEMRTSKRNFLPPLFFTLGNKALLITILFLVFRAFKIPSSLGTLIAAFSIAYLFLIVSPTPSGIGFVEGALTLTLNSFYIPLGAAAVITLGYRGITFWFPLLLGFLAFRLLNLGEKGKRPLIDPGLEK